MQSTSSIFFNGYNELKKVWHSLSTLPELKKFLYSFFFYNMGVLTVMYMATYFASDELKMETTELLSVVFNYTISGNFGRLIIRQIVAS